MSEVLERLRAPFPPNKVYQREGRTEDRTVSHIRPVPHGPQRVTIRFPRGWPLSDGPAWIRTRDQRIMSPLL